MSRRRAIAHNVNMQLSADTALIDEAVEITLTGDIPGDRVRLHSVMRDDNGVEWKSVAVFEPGDGGTISTATSPSVGGTYTGVDPAGIYWSMLPENTGDDPSSFAAASLKPKTMTITAESVGRDLARAELKRQFIDPAVEIQEIREEGLVGTLFLPPGGDPAPAVITLGGSGGGMGGARETAALLASHGFVAMSLAYFAMDGLPDHLIEIPLEYFEGALNWLRNHEAVGGLPVAISGVSRGGELVLLLGSTFPDLVDAIVAWVPSSVMWAGIGPGNSAIGSPSWSYEGSPLPFMRDRVTPEQDEEIIGSEPVALARRYLINLEDRDAVRDAAIPIERITSPLLLISGEDDAMWPSSLMADMVVDRLEEHNHQQPYRHLKYVGAGHGIRAPHLPTTVTAGRHPIRGFLVARGGEPAPHAKAQREVWPEVLSFLRESLKVSPARESTG
ncbi:MAG: acyl-CoA thioesterase/bile acid-CoA:amino acid N-acyltransferase family protein [Thermomicrobiales bacterium]